MKEDSRDEILCFRIPTKIKNYLLVDKSSTLDEESTIIHSLGEGGSGVVYRAKQNLHSDAMIDRAIKFFMYSDKIKAITAHKYTSPISQKDFLAEIINIISFNHENLIKVIDAGFHKINDYEIPFIVSEYIEGPTLEELIEPNNHEAKNITQVCEDIKENPTILLEIILKISLGIKHMHDRGFVHCDIAPKNIFLSIQDEYRPVIGDLGIAKNIRRARKEVFIAGSKDYIPVNILDYLNTEIDWEMFLSFQPRWDIYGFAKSCKKLLTLIIYPQSIQWYQPLITMLDECCEGERYSSFEQIVERIKFLLPIHREVSAVPELSISLQGKFRKLIPIEPALLTKRFRRLSVHPAILRLAKVSQLTTAYQTFPGASHSRYEHSLGVMETVRRYILTLLDQPEFLEHLSVKKIELALISGLLSSLTRFPFSNIIHEIKGKHEEKLSIFSKRELLNDIFKIKGKAGDTLPNFLKQEFPLFEIEQLSAILLGKNLNDPQDQLVYSLLNCSLDARVIDFVRRDSLHLGITKADPFDLNELLPHLTIRNHQLALRSTGVAIAEQIISLRYWLFKGIYWNRPNRVYCTMVRHVLMELARKDDFLTKMKKQILFSTESQLREFIQKEAENNKREELVDIIKLLKDDVQELFWIIFDSVPVEDEEIKQAYDSIDAMDHDQMKALGKEIRDNVSSFLEKKQSDQKRVVILVDIPYERNPNKLGNDILVIRKENSPISLNRVSGIIKGINSSFNEDLRRLRVMIHPEFVPKKKNERRVLTEKIREYLLNRVWQ